ncbi:hypothetical protein J2X36_004708 [Methylobacterium sp. BE186]|uniref:hypothetical protein n=1 Tax=Methylobacterium sp. BE186 TaxID=2817715 RepID=UPI002861FA5C|nr:hypothetical protein [Methylobacterium sp. BE186]MDR7039930.1 hypothetical protein [Methylobacterium sp. BE186]
MVQRFTVIAGGLAGSSQDLPAGERHWRVDLRSVGTVGEPEIAAWRALLVRTGSAQTPFADPDYLLPAARHQSAGRAVVLGFVWCRRDEGAEALRGVLPLVLGGSLWRRSHAGLWSPPGLPHGTGLSIEASCAQEVASALRDALARAGWRLAMALPDLNAGMAPECRFMLLPASEARSGRRAVPTSHMVGVRPADFLSEEFESVSEPGRVRDAVEDFLALDARTARRPIVADPSEAAMVRVVTRLFARRRAVSIDLASRSGLIVAGSLRLGTRRTLWRSAVAAAQT